MAGDFDQFQNRTQAEFANLARDFTAVASYKGVAPAESLGDIGFDVGVEMSAKKARVALGSGATRHVATRG